MVHESMGRSDLLSLSQELGSLPGPQDPGGHSLIQKERESCPCTLHGQSSGYTFCWDNDGPNKDVDCKELGARKSHTGRSRNSYKEVASAS